MAKTLDEIKKILLEKGFRELSPPYNRGIFGSYKCDYMVREIPYNTVIGDHFESTCLFVQAEIWYQDEDNVESMSITRTITQDVKKIMEMDFDKVENFR